MKYRKELSILGLGCMRFPKDFKKTEEMVIAAVAEGVNYFDTAYTYGGSEETLGRILAQNDLRDKVNIATKLPAFFCKRYSDFDKYFSRQLDRLKTDHIDYYLIHMLTDAESWKSLCGLGIEDWIKEKKAERKIKRIGFSFHGGQQDFLKLMDVYDWEFCLIQYNYSDENYQAGVKGLKRAAEKGIPVIIMEPLLGGKLATGLPAEAVKVLKTAASDRSPASWGLRWLWDQPEVTVVISGMNSMEQLDDNVRTASESSEGMLTEEERRTFEQVRGVFNRTFKIKCTGCGYCMPCAFGVDIPSCFSCYNTRHAMGWSMGMHQYISSTGGISSVRHYASLCKKCGKCIEKCPQHIEIPKSLDEVKKTMEPIWFKPVLGAARAFLRRV